MRLPFYSKRTYEALGKVLMHKRPDIAEELLPFCQVNGEQDISKIPEFFKRFCELREIDPLAHTGPFVNTDHKSKMHNRRLFIGCALHIYNQHIFHLEGSTPILRKGFVKAISDCLNIDMSNTSQTIRKVIFFEKTYDDFKADIQTHVELINQSIQNHGHN